MFKDRRLSMTYPSTRTLQIFVEGDPEPPADELYKVVAAEGMVGDWAAYFESISSRNEGNGLEAVHYYGNKLSQDDAERLFPDWAGRLETDPKPPAICTPRALRTHTFCGPFAYIL